MRVRWVGYFDVETGQDSMTPAHLVTQVILSLSCEESDFLTDRSFASLRMTAGASLRMTAGALLRMTAGALLRMTAGISLLAMKRW